jgi:hypothetical protein
LWALLTTHCIEWGGATQDTGGKQLSKPLLMTGSGHYETLAQGAKQWPGHQPTNRASEVSDS